MLAQLPVTALFWNSSTAAAASRIIASSGMDFHKAPRRTAGARYTATLRNRKMDSYGRVMRLSPSPSPITTTSRCRAPARRRGKAPKTAAPAAAVDIPPQ